MAKIKVLIVDDERLVRWSPRQKCEEWDYTVFEAENGPPAAAGRRAEVIAEATRLVELLRLGADAARRIDELPYMVVKKDGRREKFERQKVLSGLLRACEKRPVPMGKLEEIVNEAESFVIDSPERERKTAEIGELIMNRLRNLDKVAYVRFASVYLDFKDVHEFMSELQDLLRSKDAREAKAALSSGQQAKAGSSKPTSSKPGQAQE